MTVTGPLSEEEEVEIYGHNWNLIGDLLDRHPNTVRSFYDSYLIHHTISPKRGRPQKIDSNIIDGVIRSVKEISIFQKVL